MANITLRLHRQHDMDLIALYRTDEYKFAREMKKVLIAYANGEIYEPKTLEAIDFAASYVPTSITFHISLDEKKEEEAKVIKLLSCMRTGYRNSFAKAVFRSCIPYLPLVAFAKDNGLIMKKDTLNKFWETRKQVVKDVSAKTSSATDAPITNVPVTDKFAANDINDKKESEISAAGTPVTNDIVTENVLLQNNTQTELTETEEDELNNLFAQMSAAIH